jgi:uncharacterized protein (DUF427 family)
MNRKREKPGPGQESVWDYPRPPRLEPANRHIKVVFDGRTIAETWEAYRVLETSHPPVYYIPPGHVDQSVLRADQQTSLCEWKGTALYYSVVSGARRAPGAVWVYPKPVAAFSDIAYHYAFYPGLMDACYVDGELVQAQPGGFYGGWITKDIVGPFKGEPGTLGW